MEQLVRPKPRFHLAPPPRPLPPATPPTRFCATRPSPAHLTALPPCRPNPAYPTALPSRLRQADQTPPIPPPFRFTWPGLAHPTALPPRRPNPAHPTVLPPHSAKLRPSHGNSAPQAKPRPPCHASAPLNQTAANPPRFRPSDQDPPRLPRFRRADYAHPARTAPDLESILFQPSSICSSQSAPLLPNLPLASDHPLGPRPDLYSCTDPHARDLEASTSPAPALTLASDCPVLHFGPTAYTLSTWPLTRSSPLPGSSRPWS